MSCLSPSMQGVLVTESYMWQHFVSSVEMKLPVFCVFAQCGVRSSLRPIKFYTLGL